MDLITICVLVVIVGFILVVVWCRKELKANIGKRLDQNPKGVVLKALVKSRLDPKKQQKPASKIKLKVTRILSGIFIAALVISLVTHFVANEIAPFFWVITFISGMAVIFITRIGSILGRGKTKNARG